jgi:hypothetical protein
MNHDRPTPRIDSTRSSRDRLHTDAIVAQYILELSDRHGTPETHGPPATPRDQRAETEERPVSRTDERQLPRFRVMDPVGTLVCA